MFAETYWMLEEWVPSANAIGGQGYWTHLSDDDGLPWRSEDQGQAEAVFGRIKRGRVVRLVKVTREAVAEQPIPGEKP